MILIQVAGTGSTGNCTVLRDSETRKALVVDCGISPPPLLRFEDVVGVLITHSHNDHVHNIRELRNKPIYGTKEELDTPKIQKSLYNDFSNVTYVTSLSKYEIGPFTVTPYPADHDTPNPVHYKIETKDDSVWCGCDACNYDNDVVFAAATSCNKIMVESNYDADLIEQDQFRVSSYPIGLRDRIVNSGHASNTYIAERFKDYKERLILIHVSMNYNSDECIAKAFGNGVSVIDNGLCPGVLSDVCKTTKIGGRK